MVIEVLPADTQGTLNTLLYRGLFLINIPVSVSPIITPLLTFLAETRIYREKAATAREITFLPSVLRASDRDVTLVTWLPSRKSRLRDLHAYLPTEYCLAQSWRWGGFNSGFRWYFYFLFMVSLSTRNIKSSEIHLRTTLLNFLMNWGVSNLSYRFLVW